METLKVTTSSRRLSSSDHRQTMISPVTKERLVRRSSTGSAVSRASRRAKTAQLIDTGTTDDLFQTEPFNPFAVVETTKEHRMSGTMESEFSAGSMASRSSRSKGSGSVRQEQRSRTRTVTPTSACTVVSSTSSTNSKPPLKPRSRRNKSASSKSTSSATYVSSDSDSCGEEEASIETPDIQMRGCEFNGSNHNTPISGNQSAPSRHQRHWSSSSLAPYESDRSQVLIPFKEPLRRRAHSASSAIGKKQQPLALTVYSDDDDDEDPFAQLDALSDTESTTNDSLFELDQMIAETSARWKSTVTVIATNTVTARTAGTLASPMGAPSNKKKQVKNLKQQIQQIPVSSTTVRHPSPTTVPGVGGVIEQQQAEIETLRAALQAQSQNPFRSLHQDNHYRGMMALPESEAFNPPSNNNNFFRCQPGLEEEDITIDCAPIEHIEVNHDAFDPNSSHYIHDDLTVWSGFNTVTGGMDSSVVQKQEETNTEEVVSKTVFKRRPDAESSTGASALHGVPVRVVNEMKIELSSGMTGVTRKAVYSGTINAHSRKPEGQGIFKFTETGDIYQGDVHNGEMHGAGTYTFGKPKKPKSSRSNRPKELRGTFEHNVFIG